MCSKAKTQRRHTRRRIGERFGFELSRAQYDEIIFRIQHIGQDRVAQHGVGEPVFVEKQSLRVSIYKIPIEEMGEVVVVYDKERKSLATAMTPGMFFSGNHLL